MNKRLWIIAAIAFPLIIAGVVVYVAMPESLPFQHKITTLNSTPVMAAGSHVPETLDEAKLLTAQRLAHLRELSQEQWNEERKTVARKFPPAKISDAIARTQLRIDDLNKMTDADWDKERKLLLKREAASGN